MSTCGIVLVEIYEDMLYEEGQNLLRTFAGNFRHIFPGNTLNLNVW